jgi:hypothetical protein
MVSRTLARLDVSARPQPVKTTYADSILSFGEETALVWGRLRVPNPDSPLDKQIAARNLTRKRVTLRERLAA